MRIVPVRPLSPIGKQLYNAVLPVQLISYFHKPISLICIFESSTMRISSLCSNFLMLFAFAEATLSKTRALPLVQSVHHTFQPVFRHELIGGI